MNSKPFSPASITSALAVLGATTVVSTAAPAHAFFVPNSVTMSYGCVSGSSANCTTGQNQFQTKVSTPNQKQVLFQFLNVGSATSSITGVFFKDTNPKSLASLAVNGIGNTSGVTFAQNSSPGNFPGGSNAANFSFTANNSTQGVNQGQTLSLLFNLKPGFVTPTFTAILADLKTGSLQVGLTATGFSSSGKASFVNQAVPEPLTMLGTGAALGMGALLKRKTANSKKEKEKVQAS